MRNVPLSWISESLEDDELFKIMSENVIKSKPNYFEIILYNTLLVEFNNLIKIQAYVYFWNL